MGKATRRGTAETETAKIAAKIRQSILNGSLRPGQKSCPHAISRQLGLAPPQVIPALQQLEEEGLLVVEPGQNSTHVAALDTTDLQGIYRIRRLFEPELAARSCLLLTEQELDHLEPLARTIDSSSRDRNKIHRAHHDFHRRLLLPAATSRELLVLDGAWLATQRYMWLTNHIRRKHTRRPGENDHLQHNRHLELLTGIRSRNPAAAEALTRRHLDDHEQIAKHALIATSAQPDDSEQARSNPGSTLSRAAPPPQRDVGAGIEPPDTR